MISGSKQAGNDGFSNLDTDALAEVPDFCFRSWSGDQPVYRAELWSGNNGVKE
jgi:hypothetical protein